MKKLFNILLVVTLWSSFALAQCYLSVFTESKGSEIFIDGTKIGVDQVVKHPVDSGDHYVVVKWKGKTAYRQTVTLAENEKKVIVAEEFVEYKTDVANRSAVEMEAARIRDTRGNTAFGLFGNSPAKGLSFKQWFTDRLGLQMIGYAQGTNRNIESWSGGRLLFNFSDKVLNNNVFTTYMALGAGKVYINKEDSATFQEKITEASLGIELNLLRNIAESPNKKSSVTKSNSYTSLSSSDDDRSGVLGLSAGEDLLLQLGVALVGVVIYSSLSITHWSLEVGFENHDKVYFDGQDREKWQNFKISGGAHVYF